MGRGGTRQSPAPSIWTPAAAATGHWKLAGKEIDPGPCPCAAQRLPAQSEPAARPAGRDRAEYLPRATRHRIDRQGKGKGRSRPVSRVLSWTAIPLGAASPRRSSNLPGPDAGRAMRSLFGLAPGGVCRAGPLPDSRCALTAPFHPCLIRRSRRSPGHRRYLSVALSVGSRRPGVTWHRALWSPDFPRHPQGVTRLSGRLRRAHCPTPGRA